MRKYIVSIFALFVITVANSQIVKKEGKIFNMQGPAAGAWDLVEHKAMYINSSSFGKDMVNTTDSTDLPNFKKEFKSLNNTTFLKVDKINLATITPAEIESMFKKDSGSTKISDVKKGDYYVAKLRGGSSGYIALYVNNIRDDVKSKNKPDGDNLDYIEFDYIAYIIKNTVDVYDEAMKLYNEGKYAQALLKFEEVYYKKPNHADALYYGGLCKHNLGDYEGAIHNFNLVEKINPKYPNLFMARGNSEAKSGDHDDAIKDYSSAIQQDSSNSQAYLNRAHEYYLISHYTESIVDYTYIVEKEPNNKLAYYGRGLSK